MLLKKIQSSYRDKKKRAINFNKAFIQKKNNKNININFINFIIFFFSFLDFLKNKQRLTFFL